MKDTKDASLIEVTESFYGKRPLKETYTDELVGLDSALAQREVARKERGRRKEHLVCRTESERRHNRGQRE